MKTIDVSFKLLLFKVARDSYLQWLADQEKARGKSRLPPAATVTSGQVSPRGANGTSSPRGGSSPRPRCSPKAGCSAGQCSPKAGCSTQPDGRDSPKPGSSRSVPVPHQPQPDHGLGPGFHLRETASYLNGLPPDLFGKNHWRQVVMENNTILIVRFGGVGRGCCIEPGAGS